jgi:hypothetical protein
MESVSRDHETREYFALSRMDDRFARVRLDSVDRASMTQHSAYFPGATTQHFDEYSAPDADPIGRQQRLRRGTVFLDEANPGKGIRRRAIETIGDPEAPESFYSRRQHSFAASFVGRKIATLDNHHGEALLSADDSDREASRSSTDDDKIP